jgi:predicted restriction endonuclease
VGVYLKRFKTFTVRYLSLAKGNRAIRHRETLKNYLEKKYQIKITKKGQSFLILPKDTIVHVRGCTELSDKVSPYCFYHLYKNNFDFILNNQNSFYIMVYNNPHTSVILPAAVVSSIFKGNLLTNISIKPLWYFYIRRIDDRYFIDFLKKEVDLIDITHYLNNLNQIKEFSDQKLTSPQTTESFSGLGAQISNLEKIFERDIDYAIRNKQDQYVKEIFVTENRIMSIARRGQNILRKHTLRNYSNKCAMCDIEDIELLIASHIIPWAQDKSKRGILENIICLCMIHDLLFEKGMITISGSYEIEFSKKFLEKCNNATYKKIKEITFKELRLPEFSQLPSKELLEVHKNHFRK